MKINNGYVLVDAYDFNFSGTSSGGIFEGTVIINHSFDINTRKLFLGNRIKKTFCQAKYYVRIKFDDEVGMELKILNHPGNLKKGLGYHIYPDWRCCFCAPQEIIKTINEKWVDVAKIYLNHIIPFLYDQTYFSKSGKWIVGEYGHGDIGVIERYAKERNPDMNFTILTLQSLSKQGLDILMSGGVHFGGKTEDYDLGLIFLRMEAKKILLLNFK